MTRSEKAVQDLLMRIQSVIWELEGDQDRASGDVRDGGGGLAIALEKIEQVECTKLRIREAEQAAKRAGQAWAERLHPAFGVIYAELSTAEFAAKDALQKKLIDAIEPLVNAGYERAFNKTHQILKESWAELHNSATSAKNVARTKNAAKTRTV